MVPVTYRLKHMPGSFHLLSSKLHLNYLHFHVSWGFFCKIWRIFFNLMNFVISWQVPHRIIMMMILQFLYDKKEFQKKPIESAQIEQFFAVFTNTFVYAVTRKYSKLHDFYWHQLRSISVQFVICSNNNSSK